MFSWANPFWLLLTDSFLGLVVAAFVLILFVILVREIVMNIQYRRSKRIARDLHAFVSKHGITMADGGRLHTEDAKGTKQKSKTEDEK